MLFWLLMILLLLLHTLSSVLVILPTQIIIFCITKREKRRIAISHFIRVNRKLISRIYLWFCKSTLNFNLESFYLILFRLIRLTSVRIFFTFLFLFFLHLRWYLLLSFFLLNFFYLHLLIFFLLGISNLLINLRRLFSLQCLSNSSLIITFTHKYFLFLLSTKVYKIW